MKRIWQASLLVLLVSAVAIWALVASQPAQSPALPSLLPQGALLYIHSPDFHTLLSDWNNSPEKRAWLQSDNYAVFSQSRLFSRLAQAQSEFSTAAAIPAGVELLSSVAGKESCLALYDIGKLEFVYVTSMDEAAVEATPLWQTRSKFTQRTEAGAQFFVRQDPESKRVAAFAAKNGWLILGTREDLVAAVLDHLQGNGGRSLGDEAWYADSMRQAAANPGDLRMILNLAKIVPSPYFRSYWVQQNITEMKQYEATVSDLYRSPKAWKEERVLLRKSPQAAPTAGIASLSSLAPPDATFWSAQASPASGAVLAALRSDLIDPQPALIHTESYAPPIAGVNQAGSASDYETRIDQAPKVEAQADRWQKMRTLLDAVQPNGLLQVYSTGEPRDGVFIPLQCAMVVSAAQIWNDREVQSAITSALVPNITAGNIGAEWATRTGPAGNYFALDGQVALFAAIRGSRLFLANDADLLNRILASEQHPAAPASKQESGITYAAAFEHSANEQTTFRKLTGVLDGAGNRGSQDNGALPGQGQSPAFFSGNMASFGRVFSAVSRESIEERDKGATVEQTVQYDWSR